VGGVGLRGAGLIYEDLDGRERIKTFI
jgi:hypothetical protein